MYFSTKFIVTLEGMDESEDLRSRLRGGPEQIQEFIEEVEEWEEEEMPLDKPLTVSNIQPFLSYLQVFCIA